MAATRTHFLPTPDTTMPDGDEHPSGFVFSTRWTPNGRQHDVQVTKVYDKFRIDRPSAPLGKWNDGHGIDTTHASLHAATLAIMHSICPDYTAASRRGVRTFHTACVRAFWRRSFAEADEQEDLRTPPPAKRQRLTGDTRNEIATRDTDLGAEEMVEEREAEEVDEGEMVGSPPARKRQRSAEEGKGWRKNEIMTIFSDLDVVMTKIVDIDASLARIADMEVAAPVEGR